MISIEDALDYIKNAPVSLSTETIFTEEALNRVLAETVYSKVDIPRFNKSKMDGYAYNSGEKAECYNIVETIAAGSRPSVKITGNNCAKIMTGAELPQGANCVVRKEFVEESAGVIKIIREESFPQISTRGQFIKTGDKIAEKDVSLTPQNIAALISCGISTVEVYKKPKIGIIVTGNEIIEPGNTLEPEKKYNTNGVLLKNKLKNLDLSFEYYGICPDDYDKLRDLIAISAQKCDITLITGGVSMGDFDFVPEAIKEVGAEILFHKVRVKPGKPLLFAQKANKYIFGIPGNPVSNLVSFEIFIKPFIYRMQGFSYEPFLCEGVLENEIIRKDTERPEFVPVYYESGKIFADYSGSSDNIKSIINTNALIRVEAGVSKMAKGTNIAVRQI